MIDDRSLVVETQQRCACHRQPLAILDPRCPPFDGGAAAADKRLTKATRDIACGAEVLAQITMDPSDALIRPSETRARDT